MVSKIKPHSKENIVTGNGSDEASKLALAQTLLRPSVQASVTLRLYASCGAAADLGGLIESLEEQTRANSDGDIGRTESMLAAQAHTLDAIFNRLARQAALNLGDYMDACDKYLKLALKAQAQCSKTWETLAKIQNPPIAGYVGQANIAHGPQQVNNSSSVPEVAVSVRTKPDLQNKLMEEAGGERLDPRKTCTAGGIDPAMATMEVLDRAEEQVR